MDYTEMLKQEFMDRKSRRPLYSERAFARDLKVSAGYVSLLFRGHRVLSAAKGLQIAQRLGWSEEKTDRFLSLLQKQSLKSVPSSRRTKNENIKSSFSDLEMDSFRLMADLNHMAVLSLIQSRNGVGSNTIANLLGLSAVETDLILSRLIRFKVIHEDCGKYASSDQSLELKEVSSEAVRSFHRQALRKAEASIEEQPVDVRNLAALTLSFDRGQMNEAKAFINRFLKSFEKKFGNAKDGEIYQMNTQFFNLTWRKK